MCNVDRRYQYHVYCTPNPWHVVSLVNPVELNRAEFFNRHLYSFPQSFFYDYSFSITPSPPGKAFLPLPEHSKHCIAYAGTIHIHK